MSEVEACKLMIPHLYIQGYDKTQKILEKFTTQINLGIDGQDDDDGSNNNKEDDSFTNTHNTMNNAMEILTKQAHLMIMTIFGDFWGGKIWRKFRTIAKQIIVRHTIQQ